MNATRTRNRPAGTAFGGGYVLTNVVGTPGLARQIVNAYTNFTSIGRIAAARGISMGAVRAFLVKNGVKIRGRGRVKSVSPARLD